jgi:ubiquinone/menaquinone biosynthesis C-methylase UbiE
MAQAQKLDSANENITQKDSGDMNELMAAIDALHKKSNDDWMAHLEDRKRKELEFHDKHREVPEETMEHDDEFERLYGNKKYYKVVQRSREYTIDWIKKNVEGKVFLDYCCGNGENAILAAQSGAKMALGIDLSRVSTENATREAEKAGVAENTRFAQSDAENTGLPDNSVDVMVCSGVLHHLDLSYAFPEIRRILKPGGKVLAVEALDINPAIKLYRMLTPDMRTDWEKAHILDMSDVKFAKRFFQVNRVDFWHISSILGPHVGKTGADILDNLDKVLEKIPLIQLMAWIFTFELEKRDHSI